MTRRHHVLAAASCALSLIIAASPALAQKQGGILRMYIWDNPPSASIHEEATVSTTTPVHAGLQQSGALRSAREAQQPRQHPARSSPTSWAWSDDKTQADLQVARRREVA